MLEWVALLGAAGVGLAARHLYRRKSEKGMRRVHRVWRQVADQLGGTFEVVAVPQPPQVDAHGRIPQGRKAPPDKWLGHMEVSVEGVSVLARDGGAWTFFEAPFSEGTGPAFVATRDGTTQGDEDIVTRVLRDAREWNRDELEEATLDSNGEVVSIMVPGLVDEAEVLRAGIALVASIADSDPLAVRPLRTLPGATWIEKHDDTGFAAVELSLPERVIVGPRESWPAMFTSVHTTLSRSLSFEVRVEPGCELPDDLPVAIPGTARAALEGGTLRCERGTLRYDFDGIEDDPDALIATARAVVEVARAAQGGVYR